MEAFNDAVNFKHLQTNKYVLPYLLLATNTTVNQASKLR